jgi:predicted methyltransferase
MLLNTDEVDDITEMPGVHDASYDIIFDKAVFDTQFMGTDASLVASRRARTESMVSTFYRTLKPGGVLVIYTEHPSERILSYFKSKSQDWISKHQKLEDDMTTVENKQITKGALPFSIHSGGL